MPNHRFSRRAFFQSPAPVDGTAGRGFRKFKRKLRAGAIIRSVLFGISLGVICFAALWLLDKMTIREPDFTRYLCVALIPACLGLGIMFGILFPSKKRIARRLDKSLSLGEKVQTMVAFQNAPGDMVQIQREDTDRILLETPKRRVKGVATWLFVLSILVSVACMVGTILVPAKEPEAPLPVVEPNWYLKSWEEQALRDLIEDVRTSDMEAMPKSDVIDQLEGLILRLKTVNKESAMKIAVVDAIESIRRLVNSYDRYPILTAAMENSASDSVKQLGRNIGSMQALLIGNQLKKIGESLQEGNDGDSRVASAALTAAGIRQALATANDLPADYALSEALKILAADLMTVTADSTPKEIEAITKKAENAINIAILPEAINEEMELYTIQTLMDIFKITADDLPKGFFDKAEIATGPDSEYEDEDEDEDVNSGGGGSGEVIFGSNDTVYDPETGTYVPYGQLLKDYYAKITGQLVDGTSPQELQQMITDYFAILFDGTQKQ